MKQENTDERKERLKCQADESALIHLVLNLLMAVLMGLMCVVPNTLIRIISGGWALICVARMVGVYWALQQRYKEIEGGELDEAGKY